MTDQAAPAAADPPKASRRPFLIGLALMIVLAGAGFYLVYAGILFHEDASDEEGEDHAPADLPDIAFVPIEPLVVSLGGADSGRYLHFTAQIEVPSKYEADVTLLLPRVIDVLNGYLRAVDIDALEDPAALVRLRAQMLRRVQLVSGEGRVRDLLVTEFVIN